ncbi:MAG: Ig-like domain-containing protein, partial [Planctomycetota bacterium]
MERSLYTTEGVHTATLTATDQEGNHATSATISFTIDKTPPVITIN